ncbi:MAG: hypothetical protein HY722_04450 [Planctomycetes bacterium]|nr:hypothetical protein [Planctomycetota bacterium]
MKAELAQQATKLARAQAERDEVRAAHAGAEKEVLRLGTEVAGQAVELTGALSRAASREEETRRLRRDLTQLSGDLARARSEADQARKSLVRQEEEDRALRLALEAEQARRGELEGALRELEAKTGGQPEVPTVTQRDLAQQDGRPMEVSAGNDPAGLAEPGPSAPEAERPSESDAGTLEAALEAEEAEDEDIIQEYLPIFEAIERGEALRTSTMQPLVQGLLDRLREGRLPRYHVPEGPQRLLHGARLAVLSGMRYGMEDGQLLRLGICGLLMEQQRATLLAPGNAHDISRVLRVVDAFLSMVQPTAGVRGRLPREAMKALLVRAQAGELPMRPLKLFMEALSAYPLGSWVRLSTGEVARVVAAHPEDPLRPAVQVYLDAGGQAVDGGARRRIDLRTPGAPTVAAEVEPPSRLAAGRS